ncbi:LacI family DNA-binding transcriptional regulator [Streptomyces sp. SID13031]|uniref:LacI family DNA-binding transcriptional regulator n=1 Tax=Streptomyces sp. SID13031 TaxID=2706046 RepID=UPI0013C67382|nr:LacI family DNA-binding transcriptional regulator [Streptomyces sp. SID13031]NEA35760.1 LacI family transcriptional regulator [Streptomyces sp. SID13031]
MATVRDVAERAGVSIATVSFVLNGTKPVTAATRNRVESAMSELGYHRNVLARALAARRTRIIALAHPRLDNGFGSDFITSASRAARARGYHLVLWPVDNDSDEIGELIGQGLVDGVVLMEVLLEDARVEALLAAGTPFALIGRTADPAGLIHVDIDFDQSMSDALDHLQELGHQDITLITATQPLPEYGPKVRSEAAYRRLCAKRGLRPFLLECEPTVAAGRAIQLPPGTTAVILMNELAGFGLLSQLAGAGIDVPADLSILSFGSPALAPIAEPQLTIMRAPGAILGTLGVDALIDHLETPGPTPPPQLHPCTLEPGASTTLRR